MTPVTMRTNEWRSQSPKPEKTSRLRWGLCCQFANEPIQFRTTTASSLMRMSLAQRLRKVSDLCLANAQTLLAALRYCAEHGIGCFRIPSSILPIKTHPEVGYRIDELPDAMSIVETFRRCGDVAAEHDIRTTFHPDQFVVLNSPREDVVEKSIQDLEYHAEVAEWVRADVINIHGGGAYGDKGSALAAFVSNVNRLSERVRSRLTVENDDKTFTPSDLLSLSRFTGLPVVYDVHHHRCLPDELSIEEATAAAIKTWNREPLFHISSPLAGWSGPKPARHHDEIDINDFPSCWVGLDLTVEVEAKGKEVAVRKMQDQYIQKFRNELQDNLA